MRILFDFQDMSGGAPRSHFAHMLLAKESGHNVMATIGIKEQQFSSDGIKVLSVDNFNSRTPFRNIYNIIKWIKLIQHEKPDIIYSNRANQYKFLSVISDITNVPILAGQAGGTVDNAHIKPLMDKCFVVYSKENKASFINAGFLEDRVHVVSNRIFYQNRKEKYINRDVIYITYISNLKELTINGIKAIINMFSRNIDNIGKKFVFQIAGKDLTKDKRYWTILKSIITFTNQQISGKGKIVLLGWVDDLIPIMEKSHICIGKGRSILEPAMMGKICFVISEDGFLTRVAKENFANLEFFNFSGRGNQKDNTDIFFQIFTKKDVLKIMTEDAIKTVPLILESYSAINGKDKLNEIYQKLFLKNLSNLNIVRRYVNASKRFFCIYFWLFICRKNDLICR